MIKEKTGYFLIAFFIIVIDQISKLLVVAKYLLYQPVPVLPMFNITLAYNTGSAFSFLSEAGAWHKWFLIVFGIFMSAALVVWILRNEKKEYFQSIGLSLILGGAIGNLLDRLRLGYVVDFIDIYYKQYHWPVFNIADSAICIGALMLIISFARTNAQENTQTL